MNGDRLRLVDFEALDQLEPQVFDIGHLGVAVVRIGDEVFAFDPMCTHRPGPLFQGAVTWRRSIVCPWHLGSFDLASGRRISGPPDTAVGVYAIEVDDGGVWILIDEAGSPMPAQGRDKASKL